MDESFSLDVTALRRAFDKASGAFDAAAVLHAQVRQRALERLKLLRSAPEVILDLGSGTGGASGWFATELPRARLIQLDSSYAMLRAGVRKSSAWRRLIGSAPVQICGDAQSLPLRAASVDWVFANLLLPWCSIDDVLAQIKRVLRPGGVFTFTSVGPDTLSELRAAWRRIDTQEHVHTFIDMHDLGDALVRAGFADPVLDVERFTLTYPSLAALLSELRDTGSRNALPSRSRGLMTPRLRTRLAASYEMHRRDGTLPVTVEVVFGQAWQSDRQARTGAASETRVPISSVRRRR